MRPGFAFIFTGLLLAATAASVRSAEAGGAGPDFKEVYEILRSRLPDITEAELNRKAVQGLVAAFNPRVALISRTNTTAGTQTASTIVRSNVFDEAIGYVRVGQVSDGLATSLRRAYGELGQKNRLRGLVLDLRYTGGESYEEAMNVADLFLGKSRPVLNWGDGMKKSREKADAITVPVAVLINGNTAAAAEALASVLRQTGVALLLGSTSAGRAMVTRDFPLQNGETLRVAVGNVELGDGTAISQRGVKPDIAVAVAADDEHAFYADAFRMVPQTNAVTGSVAGTNLTRRPRVSEADLVRERREGISPDPDATRARRFEAERASVNDPVLARALDLLKGLAVVRSAGA